MNKVKQSYSWYFHTDSGYLFIAISNKEIEGCNELEPTPFPTSMAAGESVVMRLINPYKDWLKLKVGITICFKEIKNV